MLVLSPDTVGLVLGIENTLLCHTTMPTSAIQPVNYYSYMHKKVRNTVENILK